MKSRQAKKSDAHILGPLIFSSAPASLAAIFDINDELSALKFLGSSLLSAGGQYGYDNHWVAEIDNQIVGCISAWHGDLVESFDQATLVTLSAFYGFAYALRVLETSQALQDCIPRLQKHEWCIGHFAVTEQYQKQGVGNALLMLMQEKALASGRTVLSLDVDCENTQAINFYLRRGFVLINQSDISPRMQTLGIGSYLHLRKDL